MKNEKIVYGDNCENVYNFYSLVFPEEASLFLWNCFLCQEILEQGILSLWIVITVLAAETD